MADRSASVSYGGATKMIKAVMVGLDTGNWDLIQFCIHNKTLPNVDYLQENRSRAYNSSQLPPVTCALFCLR